VLPLARETLGGMVTGWMMEAIEAGFVKNSL
jgi:hypothetical protein